MTQEQQKSYLWFRQKQAELVKDPKYAGKYLVIVKNNIVNLHDNMVHAYDEAVIKYGFGKFIIQECRPTNEIKYSVSSFLH